MDDQSQRAKWQRIDLVDSKLLISVKYTYSEACTYVHHISSTDVDYVLSYIYLDPDFDPSLIEGVACEFLI